MTATPRFLPVRHDWAEPFIVTRESQTDVEVADDGSEVRAQLRDTPNINVTMRGVFPNETGAGRLLAAFRGATRPLLFYVPLWCDATELTTAVTAGDAIVECDTTTRPFFALNSLGIGYAMVWRSETNAELVSYAEVEDSLIVLAAGTVNSYAVAGTRVVPVRPMWLNVPVSVTWLNENLSTIPLSFTDQKPQSGIDLDDAAATATPDSVEIYVHSNGRSGTGFVGLASFILFVEAVVLDASGIPIETATGEWTSDTGVTVFPLPDVRKARVLVEVLGSPSIAFTSGAASHAIQVA